MFQNLDLNSIIQLLLVIFVGIFMVKMSRVLDKLAEHREKPRIEQVKVVEPIKPMGSVLRNNPTPILNNNENKKKITLEIEFPDLPEKIKIPFEKLPELLKFLGKTDENPRFLMKELENPKQYIEEAPQQGGVTTKEKEAPTSEKGENKIGTVSFMKHHDKPWLDIISRVSGLEFSEDGEKVYCPRHGWVPYIVTSDGRILCGAEYETLWDPNKDRYKPPSKKELLKLQKDLAEISSDIEELRNMASFQPVQLQPKKQDIENNENEDEEEETMEEYEEE